MNFKLGSKINIWIKYILLTLVGFIMIYPILWLIGASFKNNSDIFSSINFIPKSINFSSYIDGWRTGTEYTFMTYFMNTFKIVIPKVMFTLISCTISAYAFARFEFPMKKIFFSLLIATMFLPHAVTRIPLYLLWNKLGLLDSYFPIIANTIFGQEPFFVFMMVQFFRGIPKELDEAALMDGCNSIQILTRILLPIMKPAMVTVGVFQFMWSMNDFMNPLIYISSVEKYPVSIALKLALDVTSGNTPWNQIIAMSLIALLPPVLLFFFAQKQFIEGVSSTGLKG